MASQSSVIESRKLLSAKISVLIVDDDTDLRNHVVNVLEKTNIYHCQSASTMADAVEELKRVPFDVLSADWRLGDNDCGWLMIPPARRSNPWIAVLVYSMYPEQRKAAVAAGANSFLLKKPLFDGGYVNALNKATLSSLKRKLIHLSTESIDGERAFLAISSSLQGGEVFCPPDKTKEIIDVVSKLQLLDRDLEFVKLLRFNKISELMSRPAPVFVLSFIKDFGPISLSALRRDIQLPNNGVEVYVKTFLAAGFIEFVEDKLCVTVEGEFELSVFGSVAEAKKQ